MSSSPPVVSLDPSQVDVWYVFTDAAHEAHLVERYRALVPVEELARCERYAFSEDRRQCLTARALVRTALSHYVNIPPNAWVFGSNRYGKPKILAPSNCCLKFNASHTVGVVVCAITASDDIGVDVEATAGEHVDLSIAKQFCSAQDWRLLEDAPEHKRGFLFVQLWTLKEALVKAIGGGLSIPLEDFGFAIHEGLPPQVSFEDLALGNRRDWQFARVRLRSRYQMSIAVKRKPEAPLSIRMYETIPLRRTESAQILPPRADLDWAIS